LKHWHSHTVALSAAQIHTAQLSENVTLHWDQFRKEQDARNAVLVAIRSAQNNLSHLGEKIAALGNIE